jgi:penicillin amidase
MSALLAIVVAAGYWALRSSLPELDGLLPAPVSHEVALDRDRSGRVTIRARRWEDAVFAQGFVHAQERFFQMDLARRRAAGELSELVGPKALPLDRAARVHRLRQRLKERWQHMALADRILLGRYAEGVNRGLAELKAPPLEYLLLNQAPRAWNEVDSLLVVASMYFVLQDDKGEHEWQREALRRAFGERVERFLDPETSPWDAPIDDLDPQWHPSPIPDLREPLRTGRAPATETAPGADGIGSNNWAVSGTLTETGAAMLSNDMHLGIGVPPTWFYARLLVDEPETTVAGVSLPGVPGVVAGSNGHVAWGFTNSYGDWGDLIRLRWDPASQTYATPSGPKPLIIHHETIEVRGRRPEILEVRETQWGPVVREDATGPLAFHWVLYDPPSISLGILKFARVRSVEEALTLAPSIGIPAQNGMLTDRYGNIAWTILGPIPARIPADYRHITDWSSGEAGWQGFLSAGAYPQVKNPPQRRLWSANGRTVSKDRLLAVGDGGFVLGARQRQIRDRLMAMSSPVRETDFYRLALDDEAMFMKRWHRLATQVARRLRQTPQARLVQQELDAWNGHASSDSVGYRLVAAWRTQVHNALVGAVNKACRKTVPDCDWFRLGSRREVAIWRLVTEQPPSWLPHPFLSWNDFLLAQAEQAWKPLLSGDTPPSEWTWGKANRVRFRHPLLADVPVLGDWLSMPDEEQSGDWFVPRVARPAFGQSERMVVQPGHEDKGLFNLPVGQSAHPLSPYFGATQEAWLKGHPQRFLPDKTVWQLRLVPARP